MELLLLSWCLTVLQKYHWNTISTRRLYRNKVNHDLLNQFQSNKNRMYFQIVIEGSAGNRKLESSRILFQEKIKTNKYALSDAEDNNSGPLNRGGRTDLLFLRTLLGICQKLREYHSVVFTFLIIFFGLL